MNETISERSKKILRALAQTSSLSRAEIEDTIDESRISTIRELKQLEEAKYIEKSGAARATVYNVTEKGSNIAVWDIDDYLAEEPDKRNAAYTHIEPKLFNKFRGSIQPIDVSVIVNAAISKRREAGDSPSARKELERFVIELSWKSSKIEGNTYTLLDTERLIRESKEAPGHDHAEAVMILNHKRAFEYIWEHQKSFDTLNLSAIEEIHQLLVNGLDVPFGMRNEPVGITGTVYIPPARKAEISPYLHDIVSTINEISSTLEKALACLVLIPYLQPFEDGNKRTSRLIANAVLIAGGYSPLSYRSVDEQAYKGALILFYEQGTLANFRELFLEQLIDSAISYFFPPSSETK